MKERLYSILIVLLLLASLVLLAGCDMLGDIIGGSGANGREDLKLDEGEDLIVYEPENGESNDGEESYYKSESVVLITEINGKYSADRPFVLENGESSKRIYKNIYFYEEDYFQIIYYKTTAFSVMF